MFEQVAAVIAKQKGISASAIREDSTFAELGVDSLDAVDILMSLQDIFHIKINMRKRVTTIRELLDVLRALGIQDMTR